MEGLIDWMKSNKTGTLSAFVDGFDKCLEECGLYEQHANTLQAIQDFAKMALPETEEKSRVVNVFYKLLSIRNAYGSFSATVWILPTVEQLLLLNEQENKELISAWKHVTTTFVDTMISAEIAKTMGNQIFPYITKLWKEYPDTAKIIDTILVSTGYGTTRPKKIWEFPWFRKGFSF